MKTIKDPVHGHVRVQHELLPLLDAPPVQRLRYIRQLGFSHLVYPGANHSRYEHSLGTMHLAGSMAAHLDLSGDERLLVRAAGLLHDVGHSPFSHATESLMQEYCGRGHQDISHIVGQERVGEALDCAGIEPGELCEIVNGDHPLAGIIHGDLDVDRMDYLMRDAHYTGVPYGTVDPDRLIHSTAYNQESGLHLRESGINSAESLLIARTLMRPAVYFHHVSRIAEAMAIFALKCHIEESGTTDAATLFAMDDDAFFSTLLASSSAIARDMAERLKTRRLYKRALYVGNDRVNPASYAQEVTSGKGRLIAAEIADHAGVREESVLVDIPAFPSDMRMGVQVENHHDLTSLDELSPLMRTLNETRKLQWRLGVYTLPDQRKMVEDAASEVLSIKKPTKQYRLIY